MWKPNCKKLPGWDVLGPFLEVEMSKMCTLLWPEERLEVKSVKANKFGADFDIQMWICVAKDAAPCQKGAKRDDSVAVSFHLRYATLHYATTTTTTTMTSESSLHHTAQN